MIAKPWCLSEKLLNPSFNDHSILSWCCTLYCWLLWFQHLKTCTFILARLILDKLKSFMATIITFWIQSFQQHASHHCSVHGVASSSRIRRLTNGYASKYNIVGCLRFPLTYLIVAGTIGLLLLISLVVTEPRLSCALQPHDWATRSALVSRYVWHNSLQFPSMQPY